MPSLKIPGFGLTTPGPIIIGPLALGRADAQLELQGTDGILSVRSTATPGNLANEAALVFMAMDSAGGNGKVGSLSGMWNKTTAGATVGKVRLVVCYNSGSTYYVLTGYGNKGAEFFGAVADGSEPGLDILRINGHLGLIPGKSITIGAASGAIDTQYGLKSLHDGVTLTTTIKVAHALLKADASKGFLLGYDTAAQTGVIAAQGANGGLAFWTHNGAWAERYLIDVAGNHAFTGELKVSSKFGANGATAQAKATLGAAATDAATTQALANAIRTALINNGIGIT